LFSIDLNDYLRLVEEVAFDSTNWVDMDRGTGGVVRRRRRPSDS
jgi:hypothetical protein